MVTQGIPNVNLAYSLASPFYLSDFRKEQTFINHHNRIDTPFIDMIARGEYKNSSSNNEFIAYVNDCRTQFMNASNVMRAASMQYIAKNSIVFPVGQRNLNIIKAKKTLVLDLDETLIHSEVAVQGKQYHLALDFPSPLTPGRVDVLI